MPGTAAPTAHQDDLARMAYERDRNGPPADFPALPSIPGGRYVDPDFLALEDQGMWKKAWLYAGQIGRAHV